MLGLPLAFAAPVALVGLIVLPVVWLLIRITPPRPRRIPFPPIRILLGLRPQDETPARTPPWLLALRLLLAALIVLAMSGPLWNPLPPSGAGRAPTLVVLDDGWATAPTFAKRIAFAIAALEAAGRRGAPTAVVASSDGARDIVLADSGRSIERVRALEPQPWSPDRKTLLPALGRFAAVHPDTQVIWISDGLAGADGATGFLEQLAAQLSTPPDVVDDGGAVQALAGVRNEADGLVARVIRTGADAASRALVRAFDLKGVPLGEATAAFGTGNEASARFALPIELRNDIARMEIVGERSAGAVALLDDRWKRRRVGVVSGSSADVAQPLLAPNYYLTRALAPFADVREARPGTRDPVVDMLDGTVSVLILADVGAIAGEASEKLERFVSNGGTVVRFAGSRLAASQDDFTPVPLRRGGRILGGALSWEAPKKLAPLDETGPFAGMRVPDEVTVQRQVLAEPDAGLPGRTWAHLTDGTPLITATRRGKGTLVLFHVTADTTWSNLPLSGLFPEMLHKIVSAAGETAAGSTADAERDATGTQAAATLAPTRTLDGYGQWRAPPATAKAISAQHPGTSGPDHPPGFYGPADMQVAVNTLADDAKLVPLDLSGLSVRRAALTADAPIDLRQPLLVAAVLLLVADTLASLWLGGALRLPRRRAAAATLLFGLGLATFVAGGSSEARAQIAGAPPLVQRDKDAALATRIAYVVTGDSRVDEQSRAGLSGLSRALALRTSLVPAEAAGVDPARDELVFYPLLYWPVVASRPQPSAVAMEKIAAFMKGGGTVLFDTRDALTARPGGTGTPEAAWLRKLLSGVDVPELEPVPRDHVVTKSFYLLDGFIGRTAIGQTWIEALPPEPAEGIARPARAGDSVSPIIITSNDLSAAWAATPDGEAMYPLVPGGARQRELALRGGINIVMYTLTGNYKADQVHVRDLLERLGQ